MSSSPKNAAANPAGGAVAAPLPAPYTGAMANGRPVAAAPWWQDVVRFWVPVLGIGGAVLVQMIGQQRQIGELRSELTAQMATLRTEMVEQNATLRSEMATLRTEMVEQNAALRAELTAEMATLRTELTAQMTDLGERVTRLEALIEVLLESRAPGSVAEPGEASADRPSGP